MSRDREIHHKPVGAQTLRGRTPQQPKPYPCPECEWMQGPVFPEQNFTARRREEGVPIHVSVLLLAHDAGQYYRNLSQFATLRAERK